MDDRTLRELAVEAVALPGFEWLPGMQRQLKHGDLPDLSEPGTQGYFIELISRVNARRSKHDALHDVAHAMGRGLSIEEALVFELAQGSARTGRG